jgi:broad specificity phosphatase PhoE
VLVLVRHGQTAANAEGRLQGRTDPPLTHVGRGQARALAGMVSRGGSAPVRLLSSPLTRALETAAALGLSLSVEVDERWVELDYGELDGRRVAEVPSEAWDAWRADAGWAPPGGESLAAVGERVRRACEALAQEAAEADVVVVSHVSPIKAAAAWALGADDGVAWRMHLDLASVCRIRTGPSGPVLVSFNELPAPAGPPPGPGG